MSEKMRESFIKWYSEQVQYGKAHEDELWMTWQASRAALVVELPDSWILGENGDDIDALSTVDVKVSLDNAGISYK